MPYEHHHHQPHPVLARLSCICLCLCCFELDEWYVEMLAIGGGIAALVTRPLDAGSLLLLGGTLSPVLGTLTNSFASNTVGNLIAISFLIHLYSIDIRNTKHLYPVSTNSAFAAIILMASRLKSSLAAFAFGTLCASLLLVAQTHDGNPMVVGTLVCTSIIGVALLIGLQECVVVIVLYCTITWPVTWLLDYNQSRRRTPLRGSWDMLVVQEEEETGVFAHE